MGGRDPGEGRQRWRGQERGKETRKDHTAHHQKKGDRIKQQWAEEDQKRPIDSRRGWVGEVEGEGRGQRGRRVDTVSAPA